MTFSPASSSGSTKALTAMTVSLMTKRLAPVPVTGLPVDQAARLE